MPHSKIPRIWMIPNLSSLDAPLVAWTWQLLLARCLARTISPAQQMVLFLSVWLVYAGDRWLDSFDPHQSQQTARHQFHRRYRLPLLVALGGVGAFTVDYSIHHLMSSDLERGWILLGAVVLYFLGSISRKISFPKEAGVALLFTWGVFLFPASGWNGEIALPAVGFFLLCLLNCVAISAWENESGAHTLLRGWPGLKRQWILFAILLWVGSILEAFYQHSFQSWWLAMALSTTLLLGLEIFKNQIGVNTRRVWVDLILLSPIPFLLWA